MTLISEAELIGAAQRGSEPAFARLVEMHQQRLRGFLRRLARNHADGDDLAQDTLVTAWTRLGAFRRGESFRSWLFGIGYRKWMTHRRGEGRRGLRETAAMEIAPEGPGSPDARLDAAAALAVLQPDQRAAVALCLAADFSHAEAAETLGLPLGTVKSHVQRGRAKLLEVLGGPHE